MSQNALIVIEHEGGELRAASLSAIQFARQVVEPAGGTCTLLVAGGDEAHAVAEKAREYGPVRRAVSARLAAPVADVHARLIADVFTAGGHDLLVAASTTRSRDIVARASALLSGSMASDVTGLEMQDGEMILERPLYAGSVTAKVRLLGEPRVITVRSSSFSAAEPAPGEIEEVVVDEASLPDRVEHRGVETKASDRPDLTEARVVVSGGRAFKTTEDFESHVGALADALGGAAGSSRALVDSGITPNELQVGQTGKVVAPEIYIALGLSGAVQHLAGMKNSRVIVAVNKDPDAPIFEVSDYGLVGDVYQVVPELLEKVKATQV